MASITRWVRFAHGGHSGFGTLQVLRHSAQLSATPALWVRPSMPPGSHPLAWP